MSLFSLISLFSFIIMADNVVDLRPKKNTTSVVWKYFGVRPKSNLNQNESDADSSKNNACCRLCTKDVKTPGGNTSNLWHHLRDHHPNISAELNRMKTAKSRSASCGSLSKDSKGKDMQPKIQNSLHAKMDINSNQAKIIHHAIGCFIGKDMHSFNTVERAGFKYMMSKIAPKYEIPSRTYFRQKVLPDIYLDVSNGVKENLSNNVQKFAFTTDMWTSSSLDPYMGITVHFINSLWQFCSVNLGAIPFSLDHSGVNMAEGLRDAFQEWQLNTNQVICGTTDNASNNGTMFRDLSIPQLSCFGHNLDLAVNEALKIDSVNKSIKLCRVAIDTFSRSWKKTQDLHAAQVNLDVPEHKLIHDVCTRWGSTANMIHRFLEQQQTVNAVLFKDRKHWHAMPDSNSIRTMEQIDSVIYPLANITDTFSADTYVTVSALLPVLEYIKDTMLLVKDDDPPLVKRMKTAISTSLAQRYENRNVKILTSVCCFLDPRFKNSFIPSQIYATVRDYLYESINVENQVETIEDEVFEENGNQIEEPPIKKPCITGSLNNLLSIIMKEKRSGPQPMKLGTRQQFERELDNYLTLENLESDHDPLEWWSKNYRVFPILSKAAKDFLCVPATSCPSERLFSGAGQICIKSRNRLSPQTVNKMLFISTNLKLQ